MGEAFVKRGLETLLDQSDDFVSFAQNLFQGGGLVLFGSLFQGRLVIVWEACFAVSSGDDL